MTKGLNIKNIKEADELDYKYWGRISGNKKLQMLELIRQRYYKINNETPKRFRRVYKIIKQKWD